MRSHTQRKAEDLLVPEIAIAVVVVQLHADVMEELLLAQQRPQLGVGLQVLAGLLLPTVRKRNSNSYKKQTHTHHRAGGGDVVHQFTHQIRCTFRHNELLFVGPPPSEDM